MLQTALSREARTVSTATSSSASLVPQRRRQHQGCTQENLQDPLLPGARAAAGRSPRLSKDGESESLSTSGWGRLGFQEGSSQDPPALGGAGEEELVQGWS